MNAFQQSQEDGFPFVCDLQMVYSYRYWSVCGALLRPSTSALWTVSCCFRQLFLIWSCIKSLALGPTRAAVTTFVTSRVDRSNSLLADTACLRVSCTDSSQGSKSLRGSSAIGGSTIMS